MTPSSYYTLTSRKVFDDHQISTYLPTIHAQGVWNDDEQHMAPASGLLAYEFEQFEPRTSARIARLSYEILGTIHFEEVTIETRYRRPGRTIELLESTMSTKGRPCILARAWRLVTHDTSAIAGLSDEPIPSYENLPDYKEPHGWPGGYIESLKFRAVPDCVPGDGRMWLTSEYDMVEGEYPSSFVKLIGLVDTANGMVGRTHPLQTGYIFPNVDLQIHLHREPNGQWLGLHVKQQFGTDAIGLTSSILYDDFGPFGRAEQILTLRQIPGWG